MNIRAFFPGNPETHQEQRPMLSATHQSSRQGVFLCGDLAGQPVLKTSMKDGIDTIQSAIAWLKKRNFTNNNLDCDIVICGAGASGLTAAIEAKRLDVKTIILEKKEIAHTVVEFPYGKKIYAGPDGMEVDTSLWLEDCTREDLLEKWRVTVGKEKLNIQTGKDVTEIKDTKAGFVVVTKAGDKVTCGAVILAIGRRGNPRKLKCVGEELPHVHHLLQTPHGYEGNKVLVVGGGNSAVEAAIALAKNGAKVSISYRQKGFYRATKENQNLLEKSIENGTITVYYESTVSAINDNVTQLNHANGLIDVAANQVFILAGAQPPDLLLKKMGIKMENTWSWMRVALLLVSFVTVWLLYAFSKWGDGSSLREFPFSMLGESWNNLPSWLPPGIAKGCIYSLLVFTFGIVAMRRWRQHPRLQNYQTWRFAVIILAQCFFLFLFPEFIIKTFDKVNYWRFYGVAMPFPLIYETFFYKPTVIWATLCALSAFVVLPIIVYWHGKRLCSWVCGCGCLAETFGDRFRQKAPQGDRSRKIENPLMWTTLIWAIVSAGLYLLIHKGTGEKPWYVASYVYLVDFWLASVVGVSLYFFFGTRIWCRYFCPLAHYMRLLSAWYGKFRIKPADRCIACGECTRYCQMGIDVMKFALKDEPVNNKNSSCIGCGICVSVCPMDNLTMGKHFPNENKYKNK